MKVAHDSCDDHHRGTAVCAGAVQGGLHGTCLHTVFHCDRWKGACLWKTLKDHGAAMCFASDWPIAEVSALRGMQAQLTRVPFEGAADARLSLRETLHAYTAGGAWAAHLEGLIGRLVPGLAADLVVLDGDSAATAPQDPGGMGIALTMSGGRITHRGAGVA